MLFSPVRKIGTDGLQYRPDEESPWGRFRMRDDRADPADGEDMTFIIDLTVRQIILFGFLSGLSGALVAALAGLALSTAMPIGVWALAGAVLVSASAWLALVRRR